MYEAQKYLAKAFALAFYIHPDKETALHISMRALEKLELAANAQFKRYYYKPTGRSSQGESQGFRTKVTLCEPHLLQRLVYIESESIEKQQEKEGWALKEEDMVIRFVKHLVKVTLRRNSFYVTLGISRLLYNYSTAETMSLYGLIIQDPERVRDDYYYRSRKKRLMSECKQRFGDLLQIVKGHRGEQRFEAHQDPKSFREVVCTALKQFTPWESDCVLPENLALGEGEVKALCFQGEDPDCEHVVEEHRLHAILHPDCFMRLTQALQLPRPDIALRVPRFFRAEASGKGGFLGNRQEQEGLEPADFEQVACYLKERREQRQQPWSQGLDLFVDGVLTARLEEKTTLHLSLDSELIEVFSGTRLLAVCLLCEAESIQEVRTLTVKSGDQHEFCFKITTCLGADLEPEGVRVEVQCLRHASLFASLRNVTKSPWRGLATVVALGLVLLTVVLLPRKPESGGLPLPGESREITRDQNLMQGKQQLRQIHKLYVGEVSADDYGERMRASLTQQLAQSTRFQLVFHLSEADAVLKNQAFEDKASLTLALVNADGMILWQEDQPLGQPDTAAAAKLLVDALEEAARQ